MKKFLQKGMALLLALVLVLPYFSNMTLAASTSEKLFPNGSGTEADPYVICSADELAYLAKMVNSGRVTEVLYYELGCDINLGGLIWEPIGTKSHNFVGHFNGNGHVISNLYVQSTSDYQGLFGYASGYRYNYGFRTSTVENLQVLNGQVVGNNYVGGIVGNAATCTIANCVYSGTVMGNNYVGGIGGGITCSERSGMKLADRCINLANVSGNDYVGGIAGAGYSETINCGNYGSVTGNSYVGGIRGKVAQEAITKSYNKGKITGVSKVGGISGWIDMATVENCYNSGDIFGAGSGIGSIELVGSLSAAVEYCYNTGSVINGTPVISSGFTGATYGYLYYLDGKAGEKYKEVNSRATAIAPDKICQQSSYPGFNFTSVWIMGPNGPELRENREEDITKYLLKEPVAEVNKDLYLQQHLEFINSSTYSTVANDYRYASILWNNNHAGVTQAVGEWVYDIIEGTFETIETISLQEMSSLQNPYDAIILELLPSNGVENTLSQIAAIETWSVIKKVVDGLKNSVQTEIDWANETNVEDNFRNLLVVDDEDLPALDLYNKLQDGLEGTSKDAIDALFSSYGCISSVVSCVNSAAEGADYLIEVLRYVAAIESYYRASEELKTILQEIDAAMVEEPFSDWFHKAYNNYASCIDYETIAQNVLKHAWEEWRHLLAGYASEAVQDLALTICKKAFGWTDVVAGQVVAGLWAAETGFYLSNLITQNDTLVNCRRMLRANYWLDQAVYSVMEKHAAALRSEPVYERAQEFDAAFCVYKNLQLSSVQYHQAYMQANEKNLLCFLNGTANWFKSEAEALAVIINTWKGIMCHDVRVLRSDTVIVACPTDVYVYREEDGELVASVVNNEVTCTDNDVTIVVVDDEKAVCVPNIDDYEVKIEATDDGEMSVKYLESTTERTQYERAVYFENVVLTKEGTFDVCADGEDTAVTLKTETAEVITPDFDTAELEFDFAVQSDFTVTCAVDASIFGEEGYSAPYMIFNLAGEQHTVSDYIISDEKWVFAFDGLKAEQMEEVVSVTLYATYDGTEYASKVAEYDLSDYCFGVTIGNVVNGTIAVDKALGVVGDTVTVTVTPDNGFELKALKVDNKTIEGNTFTITGDHVVTATFNLKGGTIVLDADWELAAVIYVADDVTIDLNGYTIRAAEGKDIAFFNVASTGHLTIKDSAGGGKVQFGNTAVGNPGILVSGELTLQDGELTGWSRINDGVYGAGGTIFMYAGSAFEMTGGTITGADCGTYSAIRSNGGGHNITITGGEITGNNANSGSIVYIAGTADNPSTLVIGGDAVVAGNTRGGSPYTAASYEIQCTNTHVTVGGTATVGFVYNNGSEETEGVEGYPYSSVTFTGAPTVAGVRWGAAARTPTCIKKLTEGANIKTVNGASAYSVDSTVRGVAYDNTAASGVTQDKGMLYTYRPKENPGISGENLGFFSLEVVNIVIIDGEEVELCRWVWTPAEV